MRRIVILLCCYYFVEGLLQYLFMEWRVGWGLYAFVSSLLLIVLGYGGGFRYDHNSSVNKPSTKVVMIAMALVVTTGVLTANLIQLLGLENPHQEKFEEIAQSLWGVSAMLILAPVGEEIIFRRAVIGVLLQRGKSTTYAICLSALLFAVTHFNPAQSCAAFIIGLLFAWYYSRTGTIYLALLGHIANNSVAYFLLLHPTFIEQIGSWRLSLISALVAPFAYWYLRKHLR